ncbi:MAG: hypothetical protein KIT59_12055 [Nitrosomonas sp.]|nr:hypothetical protein [Nitrosomonas sp.]
MLAFLPLSNNSGKDKQIRHCEEHSDAAIQSTAQFIDASQELKICKTKNLLTDGNITKIATTCRTRSNLLHWVSKY